METMKKENIQLKSITKDDDKVSNIVKEVQYKNYIPLCLVVGVVGLGLYIYTYNKQVAPVPSPKEKKEIDPF